MKVNGDDAEALLRTVCKIEARLGMFAEGYIVRATPTLTPELIDFNRWAKNRAEQLHPRLRSPTTPGAEAVAIQPLWRGPLQPCRQDDLRELRLP